MGRRPRGRQRLLPPRRDRQPAAESRAHGHGRHLDALVFCHSAAEFLSRHGEVSGLFFSCDAGGGVVVVADRVIF